MLAVSPQAFKILSMKYTKRRVWSQSQVKMESTCWRICNESTNLPKTASISCSQGTEKRSVRSFSMPQSSRKRSIKATTNSSPLTRLSSNPKTKSQDLSCSFYNKPSIIPVPWNFSIEGPNTSSWRMSFTKSVGM